MKSVAMVLDVVDNFSHLIYLEANLPYSAKGTSAKSNPPFFNKMPNFAKLYELT